MVGFNGSSINLQGNFILDWFVGALVQEHSMYSISDILYVILCIYLFTVYDSLPSAPTTPSFSCFPQAGGWGIVGKHSAKASASLVSVWTPPLRGNISLEASRSSHTLQIASAYGKHNVSLAAALKTVDKVGVSPLWDGHVKAILCFERAVKLTTHSFL